MGWFSDFQKVELILWFSIVVIMFMFAYFFIRRGLKKEDLPKNFNLAAGILFFGLSLRLICSSLHDYFDAFYQNPVIMFIGNVILFISLLPIALFLEKNIFKKTKYILSLISIVLFGIFLILSITSNFDRSTMYAWIIPPFGIEFLIFACGYLYVIIKSTGNVRISAILIFVGICLIVGASFVLGIFGPYGQLTIIGLEGLFAILIPCLIIIGSIVLAKGFFGYT